MCKQYIFGPVASRRLGVSLGVDLIRCRNCSLDCVYCEAGKTEDVTAVRQVYADIEEVKKQLNDFLKDSPQLDYITFSGIGEPTLHLQLTEFCCWLKTTYPQYKIALLTNGTLLNDPDVRSALKYVDLCMPNFDASNDEELQIINRPAAGITVETLADGIRKACSEYPAKLILELFVAPGVNDSDRSIANFVDYIKTFHGLKSVQLNTLDRPGVVDWIKPADRATLDRFIAALKDYLPVETIGRYRRTIPEAGAVFQPDELAEKILDLLGEKSLTAQELADLLGCEVNTTVDHAEELLKAGLLYAEKVDRKVFYAIV